jgi:putative sigma-54 modulation protein
MTARHLRINCSLQDASNRLKHIFDLCRPILKINGEHMNINIQARGFELTEGLREHTQRRLKGAFDWASDEVNTIHVRFSDINGPRGGNDKRCLIHIPIPGKTDVVVQDVESDLYLAIDKAADRMERVLARKLAKAKLISRERFTPDDELASDQRAKDGDDGIFPFQHIH